ncbi:gp53-like domain-containing protein [Photorhabdus viridis]|uniref:gp53-like domain-containing protein n=1 Tax=Photorhabdus viridis TaxID=3163327 RepID=UPI00330736A7
MANLPETPQWSEGVYQIETSDPVLGGPDGISNRQAKQLVNRTSYLKQKLEQNGNELKEHTEAKDPHTQYAPKDSPIFTGTPTAPTPAKNANNTQIATTAFVQSLTNTANQSAVAANNNANSRVPSIRKVNGKALSFDISLNAGDVGSYAKSESDNTFLRISSDKTATVGSLLIDSKTPFPELRFKSKDGYMVGINGSEGKLLHIYSNDPNNQRRYNILIPERSGTLALQNAAIKSENGWWQCGDTGIIIQWVKVASSQQSWVKINYPISFKNQFIGYVASMSSINTSTGHTLVRNATLSTFEYQAGTPNNNENPSKVVHILFWGV